MLDWMLMPYRRYTDFSGRSQRMEYWMFTLFTALVTLILVAIMFAEMLTNNPKISDFDSVGAVSEFSGTTSFIVGAILLSLFWLGSIIPSIAVNVRRFHDRDMSGWWVLGFGVLSSLPYGGWIASIVELVILALPGTPGANRFGDDPKDPSSAYVFS